MRKIIKIFTNQADPIFHDYDGEGQGGILFSDGTMLVDDHAQDCCEHVYADWSSLIHEVGIMDDDFSSMMIQEKKNKGVILCGKNYTYFLPCYNEQNGYYNDNLDLILLDTNQKETHDLGWWSDHEESRPMYKEIKRFEQVPTKDEIY